MTVRLAGLHVAALWAIVFVQPLLNLLGSTPGFFVARGNTAADVLLLALGWTFGPPLLALAALAAARGAGPRAFRALHLTLVGALAAVLVLQPITALAPGVALPLAAAGGAALTVAYARLEPLRSFVSFLGLAPIVVVVLFLLSAPVRDVVFAPDEADAAATRIGNPKPVVVLVFDELPTLSLMRGDRTVDAERHPNFARLAGTATWYRNATSVADGTYVAVPAILTGQRPGQEIPARRTYPQSVFTLLGGAYDLHVHEPLTVVCPTSLCGARDRDPASERLQTLIEDMGIVERRLLYPHAWRDDLPPIDRDFAGFAPAAGERLALERVRDARAVTPTMTPGDRPGLWVVHHVIPHVPWEFVADGTRYGVEGPSIPGLTDQTWGDNAFLLDQAFQRDAEMTRFADTLLGETIDQLRRSGLWDDALVIVTADHGGAIGPGQSRRPVTADNFAQVAGVPLFVKAPRQTRPQTNDAFVTTLDVLPTIARTLQAETDFTFAGRTDGLRMRNGRTGRFVEQTPEQFRAKFDAALKAQTQRFPPGLESIGDVGPRPELVGRAARGRPADATIAGPSRYEDVRPASGLMPLYVTGETGEATGTPLALAVDGVVRATGAAYDGRFSFLLAPRDLRAGANDLAVRLLF